MLRHNVSKSRRTYQKHHPVCRLCLRMKRSKRGNREMAGGIGVVRWRDSISRLGWDSACRMLKLIYWSREGNGNEAHTYMRKELQMDQARQTVLISPALYCYCFHAWLAYDQAINLPMQTLPPLYFLSPVWPMAFTSQDSQSETLLSL
jgi:hypothetical protein